MKLHSQVWTVILRGLWFMGYSYHCESFIQAKHRAEQATQRLIDYAEEHQRVALVGHGFFNRFIGKELQKKGWTGKRLASSKHWDCTTYSL